MSSAQYPHYAKLYRIQEKYLNWKTNKKRRTEWWTEFSAKIDFFLGRKWALSLKKLLKHKGKRKEKRKDKDKDKKDV